MIRALLDTHGSSHSAFVIACLLALTLGLPALLLGPASLYGMPRAFAETSPEHGALLDHVTDEAGLLTSEQKAKLEEQACRIEKEGAFGAYLVFVEDHRAYYDEPASSAAAQIFADCNLGIGERQDGIILLLSMESRDYALISHGDRGTYAFDDAGCDYLAEFFLDDFSEDRWYDGAFDFFVWTERYLDAADEGEPYTVGNPPKDIVDLVAESAFALGVPIAAAGVLTYAIMAHLMRKMQSVGAAKEASCYATGPVSITGRTDEFVRTHVSREPIGQKGKTPPSSPVGGSGGFAGTSGKF